MVQAVDRRYPWLSERRQADRYEIREVEGGWAMASTWPPAVPSSQPPPPDMPAVGLIVMEALLDDDESIYTLRDCGEVAPSGPALVGEEHLLGALRDLLAQGLVAVTGELRKQPSGGWAQEPVANPATDDASLRRYWFTLTPAGTTALDDAAPQLEAYYSTVDDEDRT